MSTISEIEDKLLAAVKDLGIFSAVSSVGRAALPAARTYPSAYVFFVSDRDTGAKPRPVMELTFDVVTVIKNLASETRAAKDSYTVIDSVRNAINGKSLGLTDITPFICISREVSGYGGGVIEYALRFQALHYLSVPVE